MILHTLELCRGRRSVHAGPVTDPVLDGPLEYQADIHSQRVQVPEEGVLGPSHQNESLHRSPGSSLVGTWTPSELASYEASCPMIKAPRSGKMLHFMNSFSWKIAHSRGPSTLPKDWSTLCKNHYTYWCLGPTTSLCVYACMSIYLSIYLSIYVSIHPSIYLSLYGSLDPPGTSSRSPVRHPQGGPST